MTPLVRWLVITALLVAGGGPVPAAAHQQLLSSSPAGGDTLHQAPEAIRLTFNQAVEPSLASLRLVGPRGEVALAPHHVPVDAPTVLAASMTGPLVAGAYTVHWLVTGDDGHPVRGEIEFVIARDAAGLSPAPSLEVPGAGSAGEPTAAGARQGGAAPVDEGGGFGPTSPLYVGARWLTFMGILSAIGATAFCVLLLPAMRRRGRAPAAGLLAQAKSRAALVGLAACGVLVVALAIRLAAQSAALRGVAGGGGTLVLTILTRSTWGLGWMLQALAVIAAAAGFLLGRRGRGSGWGMAAVASVLLAVTPALSGHAAAISPLAVVADGVHVLAAGAWLGTLLVMLVAGVPLLLERPDSRRADAASLLAAFSPLALGCAMAVTATGLYAAWLHLPGVSALWSTPYGRTLLLKLAALTIVFATGAYNWRRARPALENRQDAAPLRRSAGAELAMGALVLAITAALVATPPPAQTPSAGDGPDASPAPISMPAP